jgi:hypothetical protein
MARPWSTTSRPWSTTSARPARWLRPTYEQTHPRRPPPRPPAFQPLPKLNRGQFARLARRAPWDLLHSKLLLLPSNARHVPSRALTCPHVPSPSKLLTTHFKLLLLHSNVQRPPPTPTFQATHMAFQTSIQPEGSQILPVTRNPNYNMNRPNHLETCDYAMEDRITQGHRDLI